MPTSDGPAGASHSGGVEPESDARVAVVGIGASAGGLEALLELFSHLPARCGAAFVVLLHQPVGHPSRLPELLGRVASMPVSDVTEPTIVEPDRVYVGHPDYDLTIVDGRLEPVPRTSVPGRRAPIDAFFRALASALGPRAVGIVLSGTGGDGSRGVEAIKAERGLVMVQDEASAAFSAMPRAAIDTGTVDHVLPVAQLVAPLLEHLRRSPSLEPSTIAWPREQLQDVLALVRHRTGHDFSQYRRGTIERRIERRMLLHQLDRLPQYVEHLRHDPAEADALFGELLIGVTAFFRDPEAWTALTPHLAALLADKPDDYVVRAWVPGCSTGEEAYSLAIVLRECMDSLRGPRSMQIFATDLDANAIEIARAGLYPARIVQDVSPQRLARFFHPDGGGFRINVEVREQLVFASQNLIADPPFSRLDLLSCRNLLIYLDTELQRRLLPIFHYSLRPGGLLLLGPSESIDSAAELFVNVDKKWRIFRRQDAVAPTRADFPAAPPRPEPGAAPAPPAAESRRGVRRTIEQYVDRMLLRDLAPPTVIVREHGEVVHVHGRTGLYLEPAPGSPVRANLFEMLREGLHGAVTDGIREASHGAESVQRGVAVRLPGTTALVDVRVQRLRAPAPLRGLYRVSFDHPRPEREAEREAEREVWTGPGAPHRVVQLERELQSVKEGHQGTVEELEVANEELESAVEELQSINDELQSANEELETSKEEMQSLNEELQVVNAELQAKLDELSRANNDMKNLLDATDIATVFLDEQLRIKRYTEQAKQVIRIIASDVGRPLGDLVSTLRYDHLVEDAQEVLRTLVVRELEVGSRTGRIYLVRILPYRTVDNVIDGLVLTFVDVTTIRALQDEQAQLLGALEGSPVGVFGFDRSLTVTWAGAATFGRRPDDLVGRGVTGLFGAPDGDRLARLLSTVLGDGYPQRRQLQLEVEGERRTFGLFVEPLRAEGRTIVGGRCVAMDITGSAGEDQGASAKLG